MNLTSHCSRGHVALPFLSLSFFLRVAVYARMLPRGLPAQGAGRVGREEETRKPKKRHSPLLRFSRRRWRRAGELSFRPLSILTVLFF